MTIEAMRQALEALCDFDYDKRQSAITALRAAIEQAEQPRQWQGLTGGEVAQLTAKHSQYPFALTAAIEAKLKEKNG